MENIQHGIKHFGCNIVTTRPILATTDYLLTAYLT